jgi:drug/metabolite transporter (DMT)-like permease
MAVPALWCLIAAALFGAATPAAKTLLGHIGPLTLAGLLYLGAAVGVAPFAAGLGRDRDRDRGRGRDRVKLAAAVLLGGAMGPALLMAGLSRAPAGSVALWLNLEPIATTLLAWALFKEHVHERVWLSAGLVCLASVLLVTPESGATATAALLVALAGICWALDNNLVSTIDRFTPVQITFIKGAVAGSLNLALGLKTEPIVLTPGLLVPALLVGALGYGGSLALWIAGAQQLGAARAQLLFATGPFWGLAISWVALREPVVATQLLAAGLMAAALWLLSRERHSHLHAHGAVVHRHWHRHDDGHHDHPHEGLTGANWHSHEHIHEPMTHEHPHLPDLHHRHGHKSD